MMDAELKIAFGNLVAAVADLGERYAVVDPPPGQARPALDRYTVGEFCDRFGPPEPGAPPVTRDQVLDVVREVMRVDFGVAPERVTEEAALVPLLAAATGSGAIADARTPDRDDGVRPSEPESVTLPASEAPLAPKEPKWSPDDQGADISDDSLLPYEGEPNEAAVAEVPTSKPRWWRRGRSS